MARADSFLALGQIGEALDATDAAIKLRPDSTRLYRSRAALLRQLGRWADAISTLERVHASEPADWESANDAAWLLVTAPDPSVRNAERAVALVRPIVERMPTNGAVWNTLGVALCRSEAWPEALAALGMSMKLSQGGTAHDWYFVALAHWGCGERSESGEWLRRAAAWRADHGAADEELARLGEEVMAVIQR
jgi:Flp pilus assembly protein TadD